MRGVTIHPLKQIETPGGAVLHGLRATDPGFAGFGEAYFSTVDRGSVKGWKRHRRMVMNLLVPLGRVRFVIHDEQMADYQSVDLSANPRAYARLTIEPGLWLAFAGLEDGPNMVLNIASIPHDPSEADTRDLDLSGWRWSEVSPSTGNSVS